MKSDNKKSTYQNDDQSFGDNDHMAHISDKGLKERGNSAPETSSEKDSIIRQESEDVRNKLNERLNKVRDYDSDARELPI